jgi:hypothetical protein
LKSFKFDAQNLSPNNEMFEYIDQRLNYKEHILVNLYNGGHGLFEKKRERDRVVYLEHFIYEMKVYDSTFCL